MRVRRWLRSRPEPSHTAARRFSHPYLHYTLVPVDCKQLDVASECGGLLSCRGPDTAKCPVRFDERKEQRSDAARAQSTVPLLELCMTEVRSWLAALANMPYRARERAFWTGRCAQALG